jgi:hypothetical protein
VRALGSGEQGAYFGRLSLQRALHVSARTRNVCVQLDGRRRGMSVGGSSSTRAQVGGEVGQLPQRGAEVQLVERRRRERLRERLVRPWWLWLCACAGSSFTRRLYWLLHLKWFRRMDRNRAMVGWWMLGGAPEVPERAARSSGCGPGSILDISGISSAFSTFGNIMRYGGFASW